MSCSHQQQLQIKSAKEAKARQLYSSSHAGLVSISRCQCMATRIHKHGSGRSFQYPPVTRTSACCEAQNDLGQEIPGGSGSLWLHAAATRPAQLAPRRAQGLSEEGWAALGVT